MKSISNNKADKGNKRMGVWKKDTLTAIGRILILGKVDVLLNVAVERIHE